METLDLEEILETSTAVTVYLEVEEIDLEVVVTKEDRVIGDLIIIEITLLVVGRVMIVPEISFPTVVQVVVMAEATEVVPEDDMEVAKAIQVLATEDLVEEVRKILTVVEEVIAL